MSTEEDLEALDVLSFDHRPILSMHDGSIASCKCMDRVFIYGKEDWDQHIADVILAAGFHRTPAPAPDVRALIDEARQEAGKWGPGPTSTGLLLHRLADALEAAEKELAMRRSESADFERERDEAVAALEAAAASAPQVTDEMVDAAYRAALENGADRLWKADIRAALKAALGVSE